MPNIIHLKKTDSTNKFAIENFDSIEDRTLITADSQSAGRGRLKKTWISPDRVNLYASFVIKKVNFNISISSWIGGLSALYAVRDLISENEHFWIKWPNDIYCSDRKLAGVLCETVSDTHNHPRGIIIGVGINVNMTKEQLNSIDKPATSLLVENGIELSIESVGKSLLGKLNYFTLKAEKNEGDLYKLWKEDNKVIGREVEVDISGKNPIYGKVIDIKPCGSLYLMDGDGNFHTFYSGDVSLKSFEKLP